MPPTPKAERKSGREEELDSLEDAKKALLNRLWRLVPRKFRIPLAATVLVLGASIASQSYWQPLVKKWFFTEPPRLSFGVYVLSSDNIPFQTDVRLLDMNRNEVSHTKSDERGLAGFNISGDTKLSAVECLTDGAWKSFPVERARAAHPNTFVINLAKDTMVAQ